MFIIKWAPLTYLWMACTKNIWPGCKYFKFLPDPSAPSPPPYTKTQELEYIFKFLPQELENEVKGQGK